MTHHTGSVPAAKRRPDWRDDAACRGNDNDQWFPLASSVSAVRSAKRGCFACPVIFQCAQYALRTRQSDGVWGGLSEGQRNTLTKNHRTGEFDSLDNVREIVLRTLQPEINPVKSIRDLWEDRTYALPGGHIGWTGHSGSFSFNGLVYTPKQLAFLIDRGYKATGILRRTPECKVVECVNPRHLYDNAERLQRAAADRAAAARAAAQAEYAAADLAS
jgi:hypothetical protein